MALGENEFDTLAVMTNGSIYVYVSPQRCDCNPQDHSQLPRHWSPNSPGTEGEEPSKNIFYSCFALCGTYFVGYLHHWWVVFISPVPCIVFLSGFTKTNLKAFMTKHFIIWFIVTFKFKHIFILLLFWLHSSGVTAAHRLPLTHVTIILE